MWKFLFVFREKKYSAETISFVAATINCSKLVELEVIIIKNFFSVFFFAKFSHLFFWRIFSRNKLKRNLVKKREKMFGKNANFSQNDFPFSLENLDWVPLKIGHCHLCMEGHLKLRLQID